MSWLLIVQPDPVQADVLCNALQTQVPQAVVVAESIEGALSSIEQNVPDAVLLATLVPELEDHLIAYLGTIPGAGHVPILGLPRLDVGNAPAPQPTRSRFPWRRRPQRLEVELPACAPDVFARDVAGYLERARSLKEDLEFHTVHSATAVLPDRRREPRFASHEVPWISTVRLGREQAALIDVSSRAVRLRISSRPAHHLLKRSSSNSRVHSSLVLELETNQEIQASGRVIRCAPVGTTGKTEYEVTFSFDASVGLHLPVQTLAAGSTGSDEPRCLPAPTTKRT